MTDFVVKAVGEYRDNASLIVALRHLRYLRDTDRVLDPTYGLGSFWKLWRPALLVDHDIRHDGVDFRVLPYDDRIFDSCTFDPPYKLNGRATPAVDDRYGVGEYASLHDRHALIRDGITECARVTKRHLMVKCQDQVNSGRVRWQTREFADHAESCGFELIDMLHVVGGRPQPPRTRRCPACRGTGDHVERGVAPASLMTITGGCQVCAGSTRVQSPQQHALRNYSTMLVFERSKR